MAFQVIDLRFEHRSDGLGVSASAPRLSWSIKPTRTPSEPRGWMQTAYKIEVSRYSAEGHRLEPETVHVQSGSSVLNPWPVRPLSSRETASVRVKAYGTVKGREKARAEEGTDWSAWQDVEAGLQQPSDWVGCFITSPTGPPKDADAPHRPTLFRKTFDVASVLRTAGDDGTGARARLYVTSLGVYEAQINGNRVGDQQMTPGWTSYHHRLQYQVFDVTHLLRKGENAIGVEVAEGWYAGRLTWLPGIRNVYGDRLAALVQLEIQTADGKVLQQVVSDGSWLPHVSPRTSSSIYDGEHYDAREEHFGGATADFPSSAQGWQPAETLNLDTSGVSLFCPDAPPVRVTETVQPREIFKSPSGKTLIDFGQNLVGKIRIRTLKKQRGHVVRIRHAEVLENGELGTRPLRSVKAEDTIIFSEEGLHDWTPSFTFHGFRYVELEGWSLDDEEGVRPTKENVEALVMHSDMQRTGHFHCSEGLVNRLHENVVWGMRGNFLAVPTDCPQRDERLGWTGDIQIFSPTASFIYDGAGFLANWLQDLAIDQNAAGGVVPVVVPDVLDGKLAWPSGPQAVWDDASVLVPWVVYQWSGDAEVLRRQFESMQTHVGKSIPRGTDGLWDPEVIQLGDWLDPNAPPSDPMQARTDGALVADAYLVHVTDVMAQVSSAIGNEQAAAKYQADFERLREVFSDKYIAKSGLVVGDSQTSLALALVFSILRDEEQIATAGARLARLVRTAKFRVSTGFAGTPLVLHALVMTGQLQLAYRMLLEKECPSWLYPVTMGATTVWERWDSMLPDGSINPGDMTSFNHYALGSVANWLHTTVGGISPLEPGWKRFKVAPLPGGTLTSADVSYASPYGLISVSWTLETSNQHGSDSGSEFTLKFTIPPNTTALVVLPGQRDEDGEWVGSGAFEKKSDFKPLGKWPPKSRFSELQEGSD